MTKLFRFFVAMLVAFCGVFATVSARAEAPSGGYRVVEERADAYILEIGKCNGGCNQWKMLEAAYGATYKAATGRDLTDLEGFQSVNPNATLPVCLKADGNNTKVGAAGDLSFWTSNGCPAERRALFLRAGVGPVGYVTIPRVTTKVVTFSERYERLEAQDKCFKSAECLANEAKKLGGKVDVKAPSSTLETAELTAAKTELAKANENIAKIEKDLEEAKKNQSVPPRKWHSHWIWFALTLVLMLLSLIVGNGIAYVLFKAEEQLGNLRNAHKDLNAKHDALDKKYDVATSALARVKAEAANEKVKHQSVVGAYEARNAELNTHSNANQMRVRAFQQELDAALSKLAGIKEAQLRYAELEDQLKPSHARLIEIDDERTRRTYDLEIMRRRLVGVKNDERRKLLEAVIAEQEGILTARHEERVSVLTGMAPIQKEYDALKRELTGRSDMTLVLYKEAQHDRNDAAKERAAAQADLAEAARLKDEATEAAQRMNAQLADVESRKKALDEREQKLNEAWAAVISEAKRVAAREDELLAEISAREEQVRIRKDALEHLLNDTLEALGLDKLGLDANIQLEEIMKRNGASGILYEAAQRTKIAEDARKKQEEETAQIMRTNVTIAAELERTRADLDRVTRVSESLTQDNADLDGELKELRKRLNGAGASPTTDHLDSEAAFSTTGSFERVEPPATTGSPEPSGTRPRDEFLDEEATKTFIAMSNDFLRATRGKSILLESLEQVRVFNDIAEKRVVFSRPLLASTLGPRVDEIVDVMRDKLHRATIGAVHALAVKMGISNQLPIERGNTIPAPGRVPVPHGT